MTRILVCDFGGVLTTPLEASFRFWSERSGVPLAPLAVAEPLLSTTYDRDHRQLRAGFELWPDVEHGYARRGAGEVLCGTSLDLGRLRMDCSFFRWRMEGREGVGRYDVLRRA